MIHNLLKYTEDRVVDNGGWFGISDIHVAIMETSFNANLDRRILVQTEYFEAVSGKVNKCCFGGSFYHALRTPTELFRNRIIF